MVKEVTLDLSPTMMKIVRSAFPNATQTNDRFHVQKLFMRLLMNFVLPIAGWLEILKMMRFSGAVNRV